MGKYENELICDNCNKIFMCSDWRASKTTNAKDKGLRKNIFCSIKCCGEYATKHNPNYLPCEICGKLSYIKKSQQSKVKHHCCSYECLNKLKKVLYKGEGNHQYGLRGSKNASWKDKEHVTFYGYIEVEGADHPFENSEHKMFEHRIIAEKYLLTEENSIIVNGNSYLSPEYVVHHKDGNKKNNSVDNLQVMTKAEHTKLHVNKRILKNKNLFGSTGK